MDIPERWLSIKDRDLRKLLAGKPLSVYVGRSYARFGLLTAIGGPMAEKGVARCNACRGTFKSWDEARNHDCELENDFRLITGRRIPANFKEVRKSRHKNDSTPTVSEATDDVIVVSRAEWVELRQQLNRIEAAVNVYLQHRRGFAGLRGLLGGK